MNIHRVIVSLPAILLLAAGCSSTGNITVADEEQAGSQLARQVENQVGYYNDTYLKNYVDSIGRRLVAVLGPTPYSFRFQIIDQAEPNAFATPGGYVYVSRGLLALINSEDELAGILAHEISHVTERHHAQQAQRSTLPGLLTVPGNVVGSVVSPDVGKAINVPLERAGQVYLSSFGREQETEADTTGMQLAARSGYDPAALGDALTTLEQTTTQLSGQARRFSWVDSHPMTPDRVAKVEQVAAGLSWQPGTPFARNRAGVYKRLDGLLWGNENPGSGFFRDQLFLQPDMGFAMAFPAGWETLNTPRFVGAKRPDNRALVILGSAGPPAPPRAYAEAFIAELEKQADVAPDETDGFEVGDWPAHFVRIRDTSGSEPASIYYVWVLAERNMFQIIAAGLESETDVMREAVFSLREMTDTERDSVVSYRVRAVAAADGDTLASLGEREANQWNEELTAIVNGIDASVPLAQDQPVKILRAEPY
jgi:predicted Zn-dependent protease